MASHSPSSPSVQPYPPPPKDLLRATVYANPSHDYTPPELLGLPWVATGKLAFKPGHAKHNGYSSTNFVLLGLILAQHAGAASWEDFDQSSFLPAEVKSRLPSVKYMQRGAPSDVPQLVSNRGPAQAGIKPEPRLIRHRTGNMPQPIRFVRTETLSHRLPRRTTPPTPLSPTLSSRIPWWDLLLAGSRGGIFFWPDPSVGSSAGRRRGCTATIARATTVTQRRRCQGSMSPRQLS